MSDINVMKVLIVGVDDPIHVGRFFLDSGVDLGLDIQIIDSRASMKGNRILRRSLWMLRKQPINLYGFSQSVVRRVSDWRPDIVITTGLAPLVRKDITTIKAMGSIVVNFSTDDPWNPAHRSSWFLKALTAYDRLYSPRRANLKDFDELGCRSVSWLPFAYQPAVHFPVDKDPGKWRSDVAFVGGADKDRVPMIGKLISSGVDVSLWGGYWERFSSTKSAARGIATSETVRHVLSNTTCALTLGRRSNRDGHAMRTFEVAAIGAPALVEGTVEHRELFGDEGDVVRYFDSDADLLEKLQWFLMNPEAAGKMGKRLRKHIELGHHTYTDRLETMISD